MAKTVLFTNTTREAFTHTWNSDPYTFLPGNSVYMEDWKALHFAKHLANREIVNANKNRKDIKGNPIQYSLNDEVRKAYIQKFIQDDSLPQMSQEQLKTDLLNKNLGDQTSQPLEIPAVVKSIKKAGRPKKVKVQDNQEEPFAGLAPQPSA